MLVSMDIFGGVAHIFLTESYRHATASVVAPFDYYSMLWALLLVSSASSVPARRKGRGGRRFSP